MGEKIFENDQLSCTVYVGLFFYLQNFKYSSSPEAFYPTPKFVRVWMDVM